MDPLQIVVCSAISFVAGAIDAIAGGGGLLTMPTLAAFITPVGQIVATNKVVGTAGSTAASLRFWTKGKMDRPVAFLGGAFAAAGAVGGALLLARLDARRPEEMRVVFGLLLVAIALYMGLKKEIGGENSYAGPTRHSLTIAALAGLAIGFYDGFFGPGTGSFLIFIMVRFLGFDFVTGTGNAKFLNWSSNVASLLTFAFQGLVLWTLAIPMAAANALGAWCGASFAIRRGAGLVRWVFLAVAVAIAGTMMAKGMHLL
ncbi:MAG: TSUP family transporter [Planctomycetes bacterium]|nr:TSUP family transporter [Planctomycetota bacterium]